MSFQVISVARPKGLVPPRAISFVRHGDKILYFTGRKAYLLDLPSLEMKEISGLSYTYQGDISPDGSRVLLVSNEKYFYIYSFATGELLRHRVKGRGLDDLEGNGIWTYDGKRVLLPVHDRPNGMGQLRSYDPDTGEGTVVLESPEISPFSRTLRCKEKYLLTGYNMDICSLLWYDGQTVQRYPVENFDDGITSIQPLNGGEAFQIFGFGRNVVCDAQGHILQEDNLPAGQIQVSCSLDGLDEGLCQAILQGLEAEGLSNIFQEMNGPLAEWISDSCLSADGRWRYSAGRTGLIVENLLTGEVQRCPETYGVTQVTELEPGLVMGATWQGMEFYRVKEIRA